MEVRLIEVLDSSLADDYFSPKTEIDGPDILAVTPSA